MAFEEEDEDDTPAAGFAANDDAGRGMDDAAQDYDPDMEGREITDEDKSDDGMV